jgi:hypothetical protein
MTTKDKKSGTAQATGLERRQFLKGIGGGTVGALAVAAATVAGTDAAEAAESAGERVKARYKETDHVKTFYRTNRY